MSGAPNRAGILERSAVIRGIVALLGLTCTGLLVADLFIARHPHFGFDGWFGFYPAVGFLAYCVIVLSARALRPLLRRREDYYGEADPDTDEPGANHDD